MVFRLNVREVGTSRQRLIDLPLRLEALEERSLPSTAHLVAVINNQFADATPGPIVNVNGIVFFTANDGNSGSYSAELWRSNGTAAGTQLVKNINPHDINPGTATPTPQNLTNVNGALFFSAFDGTHGVELWRSNGTAAGTQMVDDIDPGVASLTRKT